MYTGLFILLVGRANAASWKGPTILPLVIHPKSPWNRSQPLFISVHSVFLFVLYKSIHNIDTVKIELNVNCVEQSVLDIALYIDSF